MALRGNLSDLNVADLIQLQCQSAAQACLAVNAAGWQAEVYFAGGEVVHAQSPEGQGEAVVYRLLALEEGTFEVTAGKAAPEQTIRLPWSALIMEGLRQKDEQQDGVRLAEPADAAPLLTRPNPVAQTLQQLAAQTSFLGLAAVSRDGVVLAADLPGSMDVARVGAIAAGLLSLSGRSVGQLGRGELMQTLIQGTQGNLIITQAGPQAALRALSPVEMNLGMAFLEARESAAALAKVIPA